MISKTNAVLDGVTSFLKYGTLDSSNSDVSTMAGWKTPLIKSGSVTYCQKPKDRPKVVRE